MVDLSNTEKGFEGFAGLHAHPLFPLHKLIYRTLSHFLLFVFFSRQVSVTLFFFSSFLFFIVRPHTIIFEEVFLIGFEKSFFSGEFSFLVDNRDKRYFLRKSPIFQSLSHVQHRCSIVPPNHSTLSVRAY